MTDIASMMANVPISSLIDVNFILINRIFVLLVTLLFFSSVWLIRRTRGQAIHSRIKASIKLVLFGFILLYAELALSAVPSYQSLLQGLQSIIVLLCLARLVNYLIIDIYVRIRTKHEAPSFIRDMVSLVVYLAVGIISLRLVFKIDLVAIITTTTVITAAIAFAMQSTLANVLSGFSIQSDKMLAPHNWVSIKEKNLFGEIVNIGFRYTTLRNPENFLIMVPNSVVLQSIVTCHGSFETVDKPFIQADVMLGYEMPPETAKNLLLQVLQNDVQVLAHPEPFVRLTALDDCGITYQMKFCINDPVSRVPIQDGIYSQIWYAVYRAGYSFPFPHRQIINAEARQPFDFSRQQIALALRGSELFSMLEDGIINNLAEFSSVQAFGNGEVIVRQGCSGNSLFLVLKGELVVEVDDAVVGTIRVDSFFGEMSLLTGEPRSATVRAVKEVWLAEVTKELLEPILRENPSVLDSLSSILAEREQRTRVSKSALSEVAAAVPHREEYLQRLKKFFGL